MKTYNTSFNCIGLDETNFHLASTTFNSNFSSSSYPYNNLKDSGIYGETGGSNYARINVDKATGADSYFYMLFDLSSIPNNAIITSLTGNIRLYSTGSKVTERSIQWCVGNNTNTLGSERTYSTSSNPVTTTLDIFRSNLTGQEAKQIKCYVHYLRNNQNDNTQRYIYVYGASLDVGYKVPTLSVKDNNNWNTVSKIYVKQNGIWVEQETSYLSENDIKYLRKGN